VAAAPRLLGAGSTGAAGADGGFSQAGVLGGFNPWGVPGVPTAGVGFGALNIPSVGGTGHTAGAYQTLGVSALTGSVGVTASGVLTSSGLPQGVSFTGSGTVAIGELTLMGARVFDPASKKFLSQDPLPPVVGAGWFADAYSFVGHDPIGLVDPWGTRPISLEEYNTYKKEQQVKGWLTVASTVAAVAGMFIAGPAGFVIGSVLAGALSGASDGFKLDANGNIDIWSTVKGAGVGAFTGALTGFAGKAFSSGKMFLKPVQKVAQKFGSRGQALATKLESRFGLNNLNYKDPKTLGFKALGAGEKGFKKYTAEILDSAFSGGVGNTIDYIKNTKNFTFEGALDSFKLGAGTGFLTGYAGAKFKNKANFTTFPGKHARQENIGFLKSTLQQGVNEVGTRTIKTAVNPVSQIAQNEITHAGEQGYHQDIGKTWMDTAKKNSVDVSAKDIASFGKSSYKGMQKVDADGNVISKNPPASTGQSQ